MIGFIIMQIGNSDLDKVCETVMVPVIEACDLVARRVDKHNQGGLLKSEIIKFIQEAAVIVADLTNERPNVYLEVGYTMGIDKFRNLILTVRQDHFPDFPRRQPGDPKIHFDLGGYDILSWDVNNLPAFRVELEKRIRRRLALVSSTDQPVVMVWDDEWIAEQRATASEPLKKLPQPGRMEIRAALSPPKLSASPRELLDAARKAPIRTFGWPIGIFLENAPDGRPKPRGDGIYASVEGKMTGSSYDYWAIRKNGDFYCVKSIFEDERRPGQLFFNTRIVRVTEAFMYLLRLYGNLGVDRSAVVSVAIRHSGLKGRILTSSTPSRDLSFERPSEEDEVDTEVTGTLDQIEANLVRNVKQIVAPMFILFDFFELSDSVYEDIVNRFVAGEVS